MKPAQVELLIFTLQASADPGNQWAQPALLGAPTALASAEPEAAQVLDALDDAAEAFAGLSASAEELASFESGVRELRRIVLALQR